MVGLQLVVPVLGGHLGDLLAGGIDAGVVHQDVRRAELLVGLVKELFRLRGIALVLEIRDGDIGALLGERLRHGAADAGIRARDDRDLVLQFRIHIGTL